MEGEQSEPEFRAAGVLPFCILYGRVHVFLGSDFGGHREAAEDAVDTASREFAEETLGLFGGGCSVDAGSVLTSARCMARRLRDGTQCMHVVTPARLGSYHMFVSQVPHVDALMFQLATQQNAHHGLRIAGAEKSSFAWVPLGDLLAAVRRGSNACWVRRLARPREAGRRQGLRLHPCFAASLRCAKEAGLEAFVGRAEQAARTRRYETLKRRRQGPRETLDGMNRAPAPETLEPSSLAYWLHRIARQAAKARG